MIDGLNELGRLADINLARTWGVMGRAMGLGVGGSDDCAFVASGIPVAFFNGVFPTVPADDPDSLIRDALDFMGEQGVPWTLWVREGTNDGLLAAGRRAGLGEAGRAPGMVLPSIPPAPLPPDGLEIEVVVVADGIATCNDLTARGFEMPREIAERLVNENTIAAPGIVVVNGHVRGEAVTTALMCATGTTAGVYNVATPPEHRRRGYGAAVTWAVIEEGAKLGCDHAVLQASPLGAPVYREMGFVDVGQYIQLEGPPATD